MRWILIASMALLGCGSPAESDAGTDSGPVDAGPPAPTWPDTLSAGSLGERRGRTVARAVIHLHSPLSHDACDGAGWVDGALFMPECLARLRSSLCALHMDAAMLTDHAPHLEEVDFEDALWIMGDDEPVMNADGDVVANNMLCPDGHRVLVMAGSENNLMPLALERHPGDRSDPDALRDIYDGAGSAAADVFRAAGAVVWRAHTEEHPIEDLREARLDGIEIYNLHANIAPDIREEHLGLEPFGFTDSLLDFANRRYGMPPDLALLSFLSENEPALEKWDTLLAEGQRLGGSGGCDAHENALAMELNDGERGDSYRRMMMWTQNLMLVDEVTPDGFREALRAGRMFAAFEVFGTPIGIDYVAESGGTVYEMGDDAPVGATIRLTRPSLPEGWPSDPAPIVTMRIVRSVAGGREEVASGDGETLEHVTTVAGPYRAEVHITPEHARPFLGERADGLIRELPWVYTNPIFVE